MESSVPLVVFSLDDQSYALRLGAVERVIHSIEITALPEASETALGVINLQGEILPVLNLRHFLGAPTRDLRLSDQFIIARLSTGAVAFVADSVAGVVVFPSQDIVPAADILPGLSCVDSAVKQEDGTILILGGLSSLLDAEALASVPPQPQLVDTGVADG